MKLLSDNSEVAIVYFRDGYDPEHYKTEKVHFFMRNLILLIIMLLIFKGLGCKTNDRAFKSNKMSINTASPSWS